MPIDEMRVTISSSHTKTAALINLGYSNVNAEQVNTMMRICKERDIDTSHFLSHGEGISRYQQAQNKQRVEDWLAGKIVGHDKGAQMDLCTWARQWLLERAGRQCEECGWNKINVHTRKSPLHVHHIDGVASNSRPDNLRLLCPNCHALTENFGSRNKSCVRSGSRSYKTLAL